MRHIILKLVLFLPLLAGTELVAQIQQDSLYRIVSETTYNITTPMISDDSHWLTLRKRSWMPAWKESDLDNDTIFIFDLHKPEKYSIIGYRQKVRNRMFVGTNHLLLSNDVQTELLNLNKQTSLYYKGVRSIQRLKNKKQFVLYYNQEVNKRFELHDVNEGLVNTMDDVIRFYTTEDSNIYTIVKVPEGVFEVFLMKNKTKEKIYTSTHAIMSLNIDNGQHGMMIHEKNSDGTSEDLYYMNFKTKTVFSLKDVLPLCPERIFIETVKEGETYFLKLLVNKEKEDTSPLDIWYGNDNQLEEKFYPPTLTLFYVWEPKKKLIQQIGNDRFSKSACIGNHRYFLTLDPYSLQDYTSENVPLKVYCYDREKNTYSIIDTITSQLYTSPNGQYALYFKGDAWHIHHIPSGAFYTIHDNRLKRPYFTNDGKEVFFEGDGGLWHYDLRKKELLQLSDFNGYNVSVQNGISDITLQGFNFYENTIDLQEPLLLKLYDPLGNRSAYLLWENEKFDTIVPLTNNHIRDLVHNEQYTQFSYIEENYSLPPRLVRKEFEKKQQLLYQSNKQDKVIFSQKQEVISYKNSDGIPLKGILFYPLNYNTSQKYPMVVHIYEKQNNLNNLYQYPTYYEGLGFNIRLFLEKGYFVYLPDILIQGKDGPGIDALDCVNHALDALSFNLLIDKDRIGLIGHSFGGYETDFIATHSDRFAAYVAGSGVSDIIWDNHSFNYNFYSPDYKRIEDGQYKMRKPLSADKDLYFRNNPIYWAEKVNAPVLLWTGMEDQNVTSDQTMAFYNALRRNKKNVIALFYKGEGHSLQQLKAQLDLTTRVLDWFNYFLKNKKDSEWINKGVE